MLCSALIAFCVLPAPPVRTPQSYRKRLRGIVTAVGGRPWVGARVTLVSCPFQSEPTAGPVDVVRVISDARGRFAANVIPGRPYSVWADAAGKDGRYRATTVYERAAPGIVARLVESRISHRTARFKVTRREAWADQEPLRFFATTQTENPYRVDLKIANGEIELPPLPGTSIALEAVGKDGSRFMYRTLPVATEDTKVRDLALPERFDFLVRVLTRKGSKPVAGVSIDERVSWASGRAVWMHAGKTDDQGWAKLRVTPYQVGTVPAGGRQYLYFRASGKGCALAQFGRSFTLEKDRDLDDLIKRNKPDHTVKVYSEARAVRGRVLLAGGKPAAKLTLLLFTSIGNSNGRSFHLNLAPRVLVTDANGGFESEGFGPRFAYRICALPDAKLLASLAGDSRVPLAGVVWLAHGVADGTIDLGDSRLDRLHEVTIRANRADGFPARRAEIVVGEYAGSVKMRLGLAEQAITVNCGIPFKTSLGPRGAVRLLLPESKLLYAAAVLDGAFAIEQLDPAKRTEVPLALAEPFYVTGRVLNGSGKAVPSAIVQANPMRYPKGFNTRLANIVATRFVNTDEHGKYRLGLPFKDTTYYLYARIQIGQRWYNTMNQNLVTADSDGVSDAFDLEVPVPDADLPKKRGGKE